MADTVRSAASFLEDVRDELQKVTWPDWPQLKNSTFVILVFVVVITVLIFGIDLVVNNTLQVLGSLFGA